MRGEHPADRSRIRRAFGDTAYSGRLRMFEDRTRRVHRHRVYSYEQWLAKRGRWGEPIVEFTVNYAIPDIAIFVTKVESWAGGEPIAILYPKARRTQ
jgi:hypothetical protein